jgi:hypothetical protein
MLCPPLTSCLSGKIKEFLSIFQFFSQDSLAVM